MSITQTDSLPHQDQDIFEKFLTQANQNRIKKKYDN